LFTVTFLYTHIFFLFLKTSSILASFEIYCCQQINSPADLLCEQLLSRSFISTNDNL